jgi:hypothetical protein
MFANKKNVHFDLSLTPPTYLYSEPEIVITDMSGFAFVHALVTRRKPVFFIAPDEEVRHPKFLNLIKRFGHKVSSEIELVELLEKIINKESKLDENESVSFDNIFKNSHNCVDFLFDDLLNIKNNSFCGHWIKVPLLYSNKLNN